MPQEPLTNNEIFVIFDKVSHSDEMEVNVLGIVGIVIFYLVILLLGIWAGCKKPKHEDGNEEVDQSKEVMLAGRGIGLFVGCFTMTGKNLHSV